MDRSVILRRSTVGLAALAQAGISMANLVVAVGVLPAMGFRDTQDFADPAKVQHLAGPLMTLEMLKIASALALIVTIVGVSCRLRSTHPALELMVVATGVVGTLMLFSGGALGLFALSKPHTLAGTAVLNTLINRLGLAAIAAIGVWILAINWTALHAAQLPKKVAYLGLLLGSMSLMTFALPPFALSVLILGGLWFLWLGLILTRRGY